MASDDTTPHHTTPRTVDGDEPAAVPEGLVEFVPEVLMMDQGTRARGLY